MITLSWVSLSHSTTSITSLDSCTPDHAVSSPGRPLSAAHQPTSIPAPPPLDNLYLTCGSHQLTRTRQAFPCHYYYRVTRLSWIPAASPASRRFPSLTFSLFSNKDLYLHFLLSVFGFSMSWVKKLPPRRDSVSSQQPSPLLCILMMQTEKTFVLWLCTAVTVN
uniref:Uncharacterized protein n=1 Tax=Nothobranchius kadleci TaxID=1051664 RepID=A0A1A8CKY5_NOTKA